MLILTKINFYYDNINGGMVKVNKFSLSFIAFIQALSLMMYCGLIAVIFWRGNQWFGKVPNYLGPFLFLILFTTSALISAILTLGYPFILFWQKKQTIQALKLVIYTALWLLFFTLLTIFLILQIR